jgi:soluble lytic murein transglycosylase
MNSAYTITRLTGFGTALSRGLGLALGLALGFSAGGVPIPAMAVDAQTSRTAEAALPRLTPPKTPARRVADPVFSAIALGRWSRAYALARRGNDPVLSKVVDWIRFTTAGEPASFEEIATFIDQNPDWPEMKSLRANAEVKLNASVPTHRVIDWLGRHEPTTPNGAIWLADAFLSKGEKELARRLVRRAWVEMNFSGRIERYFYRRYRRMLTAADHVRRLDRLLWRGRNWEARRMLPRVNAKERIIAVARIRLRRFRGGVDWAVRRMPPNRLNDLGFVYERLKWRRRKSRDSEAIALLQGLPKTLPHPKLWWRERGTLARRALRKGNVTLAYRLASSHRQSAGAGFADAEWLAGWIALRFLKDSKTAARHFERLWSKVRYPVSRSRAAYWTGRAAEAEGDAKKARDWYAKAGRFFTSFYGQLALGRLTTQDKAPLPPTPNGDKAAVSAYLGRHVVRAANLIAASQDRNHFRAFIKHLSRTAKKPAEYALAAEIALRAARPDIALRAAKRALRKNVYLMAAGWPRDPLPQNRRGLEDALLLALMRQESAFDRQALSWAGARGLMQLMPATAKVVAKRLNMPFSRKRLLADHQYNITIGTAYLSSVVSSFGGSYVLGLAAYNAGPSRARRWLRHHGDFRSGAIDAVDWIEMIPFDETRDYVQRVIENLQVYRAIFGNRRITDTALKNAAL